MTIETYITHYLEKTIHFAPENKAHHIGLPHPYVTPCSDIYDGDQYYWDSYFIILGLLALGKTELAQGMVDNLAYLFNQYAIMPMRNRWSNLGLSQPPYFTQMVFAVFDKIQNISWLEKNMRIAEDELTSFWMSGKRVEKHVVYKRLSRYADHYLLHDTAEHESGWDMNSRFNRKCLNILPIDLNCCLYRYEVDLAEFYAIIKNKKKHEHYTEQAEKRKETLNQLMWNEEKGFFFDYDYKQKKQLTFYSLAGFYPLWAGLATKNQAEKMKNNLSVFEYEWGLATSQKTALIKPFRQWDYPNGWPNLQWIVISGLQRYGYTSDAKRLTEKWLALNEKVFKETGKLWEKYDVVKGTIGKSGLYKTQSGFGWTNMVYVLLKQLST
jgi:alpha,alpha-trehalase